MIELLVVVVVFMIGVLAIMRIFPTGLRVIATTRASTIANQLAHAEVERIQGRSNSMPEMILPLRNVRVSGQTLTVVDPDRDPNDMGPITNRIDRDGMVRDAGDEILGYWPVLSGLNGVRRIIGESGPVPAPRKVGAVTGGLMVLNYGPIDFDLIRDNLAVYGGDLVRHEGAPAVDARVVEYEYYVEEPEEEEAKLYLPAETARNYRLAMTAWIDRSGKLERRQIVNASIAVPASPGDFFEFDLETLFAANEFKGAEFDSIQIAREFARVTNFTSDPYEYRLLDPAFGMLLFNPNAHTHVEMRANGERTPLRARVDYDVMDWRVLKEDFRVPDGDAQWTLKVGNLLTTTRFTADEQRFTGINIPVQTEGAGLGTTETRALLVLDLETGGVFLPRSFSVNNSSGVVTFLDTDNDQSNGVQCAVIMPGQTVATEINATGRLVRAFSMATGEWGLQIQKAADRFRQVLARPGFGECYVGGSAAYFGVTPLSAGEALTRIYFPRMDNGKKVSIGQIWYEDSSGNVKEIAAQDFLIQGSPADSVGLPYIDIRTVASDAVEFNFDLYGYAVKNVRGASVSVRVAWNTAPLRLTADMDRNAQIFNEWGRNWTRFSTEAYIRREANP